MGIQNNIGTTRPLLKWSCVFIVLLAIIAGGVLSPWLWSEWILHKVMQNPFADLSVAETERLGNCLEKESFWAYPLWGLSDKDQRALINSAIIRAQYDIELLGQIIRIRNTSEEFDELSTLANEYLKSHYRFSEHIINAVAAEGDKPVDDILVVDWILSNSHSPYVLGTTILSLSPKGVVRCKQSLVEMLKRWEISPVPKSMLLKRALLYSLVEEVLLEEKELLEELAESNYAPLADNAKKAIQLLLAENKAGS